MTGTHNQQTFFKPDDHIAKVSEVAPRRNKLPPELGSAKAWPTGGQGVPSGGGAQSSGTVSSERQTRLAKEHRRLHDAITNSIRSTAAFVNCGIDPIVEELACERNLGKHDIVALRVLYGNKVLTVAGIPKRVWRDRDARRRLLDMKFVAGRLGIRIILVPAGSVLRSARRKAAQALARSRALHPTRSERILIMRHVLGGNRCTLQSCAAVVARHADPIGLVLNLCATGWLHLDRSVPLGPDTPVGWVRTC